MKGKIMKFQKSLSARHNYYLTKATELAKLSDCRFQHGAIIRKAGKTLAVGINRTINDPAILENDVAKYHAAVHAEVAAIKACRKSDLNGATIYVARVNKSGDQMMSKPCVECQKTLKKYGVKKVYYTIDSSIEL